MPEFIPYQSYVTAAAAEPLLDLLRARDLPFVSSLETREPAFDVTFAGNTLYTQFVVQVRPDDVQLVRQLEEEVNSNLIQQVGSDYPLLAFSNEELIDILTKQPEWSNVDVTLARQLLEHRGYHIPADTVHLLRQNSLQQQDRPGPSYKAWLIFGYVSALIGGIPGLFMGAHLHWHRRQLSNGQKVYAFSESDRKHGFRIFLLGLLMFVLTTLGQLL